LIALPHIARAETFEPNVNLVTELPISEVFEGHLWHADRLWVARSGTPGAHLVSVYAWNAGELTEVERLTIPHTPGDIRPGGSNSVLVVGKRSTPYWQTFVTRLTLQTAGRVVATTTNIPSEYQVSEVVSGPGGLLFTEIGLASLIQSQRNQFAVWFEGLSNPGRPRILGKDLWLIERGSFVPGDEKIVRINLDTQMPERIYEGGKGITDLLITDDDQNIIVNQREVGNILVFKSGESASGHEALEVDLGASTNGMATLGRCLVAVSDSHRNLVFVRRDSWQVLGSWSINQAGDRLKQPRQIAIDPATHTIFVRSTYLCGGCSVTQSSVFAFTENEGDLVNQCIN
jgi:hypothetical protein